MVLYGKQPGGSGQVKPARRPCNDADETPWCMHCGGQWGGQCQKLEECMQSRYSESGTNRVQ